MNEREFLRASEVAPLLGLTTGRVYQLISAKIIPATKIGGAIRIPRAAWEAWLKEQRKDALSAVQRRRKQRQVAVDRTKAVRSR